MSLDSNATLLPCPFCGKEMEILAVGRDWYDIKAVPEHEPACMIGEATFRVPQIAEQLAAMIEDWNARSQPSEWVATSERMPESGVIVLAHYKNPLGKDRIIRATYQAKFTHEASLDNDDLECDYNEEVDTYYWPQGWYEQIDNWDDYSAVIVQESVMMWMPLPEPPALLPPNTEAK